MKRTSIVLIVLDLVLFTATAVFAAGTGGQSGYPAGAGVPQRPAAVQPNRPENAGSIAPRSIGQKPETTGKLESASPKDAMGFKNYGQYVAATHVSENLNIPTVALRTEMVDGHLSLGDAIKKLRPELSSRITRAEVKKAEAAAKKAEAEARKEPIDHLPLRRSN
jgi:hypothetical protein